MIACMPMRKPVQIPDKPTPNVADGSGPAGQAAAVGEAARAGRIGLFTLELRRTAEVPGVVRHWCAHEAAMLLAARASLPLAFDEPWTPGNPWIVWRLLSANNRELARGVGSYRTADDARMAASVVVARAAEAVPTLVFDPERHHGWSASIEGVPVMIAPSWHQSRRTNRLNLDKALMTLRRADVGGAAATIGGGTRARGSLTV